MLSNSASPISKTVSGLQRAMAALVLTLPIPVLLRVGLIGDDAIFRAWQPMQFNAALGVLALGCALLALVMDRKQFSRGTAIISLGIGALTAAEFVFGVNFGIDEIFRTELRPVYIDFPGRMAFSSSVSLVLLSCSLLLVSWNRARTTALAAVVSIAPLVLGIAVLSSGGPSFQKSASNAFYSYTSLPAATAFTMSALLIGNIVFSRIRQNSRKAYLFYPTLLACVSLAGVLVAWQYSLMRETQTLHDRINTLVEKAVRETNFKIDSTAQSLSRFAARVEYLGMHQSKLFDKDAANYVDQIKVLVRLGITDSNLKVVWSYPKHLHSQVAGYSQGKDADRAEAFLRAKASGKPALSKTIALRSGTLGNILPVALHKSGRFLGAFYGTVDGAKLFQGFLSPEDFHFEVNEGGKEIVNVSDRKPEKKSLSVSVQMEWGQVSWTILVTPTIRFVQEYSSQDPTVILLAGLAFTILIGLLLESVFRAQKEHDRLVLAESANSERLEIALDASQIAAWSVDLATGEIWRSKHHDLIFGHPHRLEVWDQSVLLEHVVPEDREAFARAQAESFAGLGARSFQFRIRRKDTREVRWVEVIPQFICDSFGHPVRLMGTIQDIHQKKLDEMEHQLDAEWRKAVLNSAGYSIISTDKNGIIQTFNPAAARMLGYDAFELVGKTSPFILHLPEEIEARSKVLSKEFGENIEPGFETFVAKAKRTGIADENEWTYVRKDGSRLPVSLSVSALRGSDETVIGYLGMAIELTEKKKAEADLRVAHDRLQRVIEATGEGIWERDYNTGEIDYIDAQGKSILGYAPEETLTYAEIRGRLFPEDQKRLAGEIGHHIEEKTERFDVEFRLRDRFNANSFKWIRSKGKVALTSGAPHRQIIATFSDVTEAVNRRELLEEALAASDAATKAKSAFLARVSHEIRTPLNGVIGMTELLLESDLRSDQRGYAQIAQNSGATLLALINDILDFSKAEAGKMELDEKEFDIASLIESQLDILSVKAREKRVSLASFVSPDLPEQIVGDSGRMAQVLLNLLSNALKFTVEGGVVLRATRTQSNCLRVEVRDTGIGISGENIGKLFKPFSQADSGIMNKFGGTGLGLSICKHLVEAMGGQIGVHSELGKGSIFWFEVPMDKSVSAEAREKSANAFAHRRYLIIEGSSIHRETIEAYLKAYGSTCVAAASIAEASARVGSEKFDLVFLGCAQPQDGLEFLRAQARRGGGLKIAGAVFLSHFGANLKTDSLLEAGYSDVLSLPVKRHQLLDCLRGVSPVKHESGDARISRQETELRVLVAEDNPVNQLIVRKMLESMHHSVTAVMNGREALEVLSESEFDLVFMDCQMPELDGFEATRRIRALNKPWAASIPIIALTANAMDSDAKACFAAGMSDFLSKPFRREQMASVIEKWLMQFEKEAA